MCAPLQVPHESSSFPTRACVVLLSCLSAHAQSLHTRWGVGNTDVEIGKHVLSLRHLRGTTVRRCPDLVWMYGELSEFATPDPWQHRTRALKSPSCKLTLRLFHCRCCRQQSGGYAVKLRCCAAGAVANQRRLQPTGSLWMQCENVVPCTPVAY